MDALRSDDGDKALIHIVAQTDSICGPCPNRVNHQCQTEAKIQHLDQAHLEALQIKPGMTLTWGEAKKLIREKMTLEKFHTICASCRWKDYGICEGTLTSFLK